MNKCIYNFILFAAGFLMIIFTGSFSAYAAECNQTGGAILEGLYQEEQDYIENAQETIVDQSELFSLYEQIEEIMTDQTVSVNSDSDQISSGNYYDYYAGSYIDEGKLIVNVTSIDETETIDNENIEYRIVEYSYNLLSEMMAEISDKYENLYELYSDDNGDEFELLSAICGFGIDEESNAIIVDIVDLDDEKENLFLELFGSDYVIEFQEEEDIAQDAASYQPGQAIRVITARSGVNITCSTISIGFRAYRKTSSGKEYGFATCGHAVKDSYDEYIYSETSLSDRVGICIVWQYSGSADASFIKIANGNSIKNQTYYSDSSGSKSDGDTIGSNTYMTSVAKGSTVYKVGSKTYKTSATVKNVNYTTTVNGVTFENMTKTTSFCDSGDSGGLVYMYYNGEYKPAGLIKGYGSSYSIYTKASEVVNEMGVYPY